MKNIAVIVLLITSTSLFAQNHPVAGDIPRYKTELTTANDNVLKGLLLEVKDSSLFIYPGKRKDWRRKTIYAPVEFGYTNIQQVSLKRKNGALKGMLIGGGIGTAIFAGSLLFPNRMQKNHHAFYTFSAIPLGFTVGAIVGSMGRKEFNINGSEPVFNEFKKRMQ